MEKMQILYLKRVLLVAIERTPRLREVRVTTCPDNPWKLPVMRLSPEGEMLLEYVTIELKPLECQVVALGHKMLKLLDEADLAAGLDRPRDLRGKETILVIRRVAQTEHECPTDATKIQLEIGVGFEEPPQNPTVREKTK